MVVFDTDVFKMPLKLYRTRGTFDTGKMTQWRGEGEGWGRAKSDIFQQKKGRGVE